METVLVQITDDKAYKLLDDLEDLQIIQVLQKSKENRDIKLSEKYRGKLSSGIAEELQRYVSESRDVWSNRNI